MPAGTGNKVRIYIFWNPVAIDSITAAWGDPCETGHKRRVHSQRFLGYGRQVGKLGSSGKSDLVILAEGVADFFDEPFHYHLMLAEVEYTSGEESCGGFAAGNDHAS